MPTMQICPGLYLCVLALQVDKACTELQMAAFAALQPISSELKRAIFDMAGIPLTPMAWE